MPSVDVYTLKLKLKEYFDTSEIAKLIEQLKISGLKLSSINILAAIVKEAVEMMERVSNDIDDVVEGADKRKAVVEFLDDIIKLPIWAEPFDGMVIGIIVDKAVAEWNDENGKNWIEKILDKIF
jgi:hypothetical protein